MTTVAQTQPLPYNRVETAVPASASSRRHRGCFGLVVPATFVLACTLLHLWPSARNLMEFDRTLIQQGQYWRLVTGQLVHFDWAHLLSDAGTCGVLYWVGRRRWGNAGLTTVLSAVACGMAVYFAAPQVGIYRGLSGIGYGTLAWTLVRLARDTRSWRSAGWIGLLALMVCKVLWDLTAREPLLPSFLPPGVAIISVAHLAGVAVGVGMGLAPNLLATYGRLGCRSHRRVRKPPHAP
jgi:rhomboid family GlyGly-CTERM serine protease